MAVRLGRVALLLLGAVLLGAVLGAVLLGTVGLSVGSWLGGRGAAPPPSTERAQNVAAQLLPGAASTGESIVRNSPYGVLIAADDFGSGHVEVQYETNDGPDCPLSEQLRRNAATKGWQGLRRVLGHPCDGWRAEKGGLTVTLTHGTDGSMLTIESAAPAGLPVATITGTLLGAAAGGALFWLLARRRRPVPLLVGTLVTVGLLPGVALTWALLAEDQLATPVWPVWRGLAPVLAPLWVVLALVGGIGLARRRERPGN